MALSTFEILVCAFEWVASFGMVEGRSIFKTVLTVAGRAIPSGVTLAELADVNIFVAVDAELHVEGPIFINLIRAYTMALFATDRNVCARERETRFGMVKFFAIWCVGPTARHVASVATFF